MFNLLLTRNKKSNMENYILPKIVEKDTTGYREVRPYTAERIFTPEECDLILQECLLLEPTREYIAGEGGKNSTRRDILADEFPWIWDRMYRYILKANAENFGFSEDFVMSEPVYLNEYRGDEYCGWHVDGFTADNGNYMRRKLTCVVQLSKPEDYTGGEFELYAYHGIKEDIKPQGTAYIIPSFEWHQVKPINSGVRRSLIMFLEGENSFK